MSGRVVVLDHPVVRNKTTLLRSVDTDMRLFRALVHEISLFVLYEATRLLPSEPLRVQTPMAPYDGARVPGSKSRALRRGGKSRGRCRPTSCPEHK